MDRVLDVHEIAQSCYRLYQAIGASRGLNPMGWDALPIEQQAMFIQLATKGPKRLELWEGMPLSEVGFHVRQLTLPVDSAGPDSGYPDGTPEEYRLLWEAIARHLFTLVDCEDLDSAEDSERMWLEWFNRKAPRTAA